MSRSLRDSGRIRPASPLDLDSVGIIDETVFGSESYSRLVLRQLLDAAGPLFLICQDHAGLLGYVVGLVATDGATGWVVALAVLPSARRQGLGLALINAATSGMKERGCKKILLTVHPSNAEAVHLFERVGFRSLYEDGDYFGPGQLRRVMEKTMR